MKKIVFLLTLICLTASAQRAVNYDSTGALITPAGLTLRLPDGTPVSTLSTDTELLTHSELPSAHGADSANTASTIVRRDASGNFSAGTITASLTGSASQLGGFSAANYPQGLVDDVTVNIGTVGKSTKYLNNVSAVDVGDTTHVDLACTSHGLAFGDPIKIYGGPTTAFNDDNYIVDTGSETDTIRIETTYVSADFGSDSTSVYYIQSTTDTDIQELIDAEPKNLNGKTLTFQFADGWYNLDSYLEFKDFIGGSLQIYGNATDNVTAERKHVVICSADTNVLNIQYNCKTMIKYIRTVITSATMSTIAIDVIGANTGGGVYWCSTYCNGLGTGLSFSNCPSIGAYYNYIRGGAYGIRAYGASHIVSGVGYSVEVEKPINGLTSVASTIYKASINQPTGIEPAYDEVKVDGGQIY